MTAGSSFGVVFCGGGPAATGLVLCAAADGRLDELLAGGVCILEQGELLGPGALGRHPLSANTRGSTFLRCLEGIGPGAAFDVARAAASTSEVSRFRHVFPRLPVVGRHLETLGRAVQDVVGAADGCTVITGHAVRRVALRAGGGVEVSYEPSAGGPCDTVTADRAVLAMGGIPRPQLEDLALLPGLRLAAYRDKLCHAAALLDDAEGMPVPLRQAVARTGEAVVVGGSHSAWSAAWMLVHDPALRVDGRPPRVTVLHRSPLRFYFGDAARARAAGYSFDEERDVCPRTGMVHRHGGLRSDARALAWEATREDRCSPVRAVALVDEPGPRADAVRALDAAGAVVAGVGYFPRLPRLCRPDGGPLRLAVDQAGTLVTERAQVVSEDGTVLPELLAFGLGAGPPATGDLAGEPSYLGRLDSVSLYQAEVGRIALASLLGPAHP